MDHVVVVRIEYLLCSRTSSESPRLLRTVTQAPAAAPSPCFAVPAVQSRLAASQKRLRAQEGWLWWYSGISRQQVGP